MILLLLFLCSLFPYQTARGTTNYVYLNHDDLDNYVLLSNDLKPDILEISEIPLQGKFSVVVSDFQDTLLSKGWGVLNIETSNSFPDGIQAYAAGFAEGYATAHQILSMAKNVAETFFKEVNEELKVDSTGEIMEPMPKELIDFFEKQEVWTYEAVLTHTALGSGSNADFFFHVGLLMEQFQGLVHGYEAKRILTGLPALPRWVFHMLNGSGDLNDLIPALLGHKLNKRNFFEMNLEEAIYQHGLGSHCSALVKILPGNEDLLLGHNSWFSFRFTNRIFKHYTLNFNNAATAAKGVSFSSYPGFLESLDDFYMLSSGLSWIQTSNQVLNKTVYEAVTPYSLLAWQRVRVSSAMSRKGSDFLEFMSKHFSGTYANQYIVVDFNLFTPGKPLQDNTLWIVEEMPGLIVGSDQTEILRYGYWPSYNVPFFPEVHTRSGYSHLEQKFSSNAFSHSLAPRAEIFRDLEHTVSDLEGLKRILRHNDYLNDRYSESDPSKTLCSRYDLIQEGGFMKKKPYGCYDAKVTSYLLGAMSRRAEIVAGPTSKYSFGASYLEAFAWEAFPGYSRVGLPDAYNFTFFETSPLGSEGQAIFRKVEN